MKIPSHFSLLALLAVVLLLTACSSQEIGYYATKGIWNRKLKTPTRVDCLMQCGVDITAPVQAQFADTRSSAGWYDYFVDGMRTEMASVKNIILISDSVQYELIITGVRLREDVSEEYCGEEVFALRSLNCDVDYTIQTPDGTVLAQESANTYGNESLKQSTDEEGNVTCRHRRFQLFSFESLMRRALDKVVSVSTNKMRRHQKHSALAIEP